MTQQIEVLDALPGSGKTYAIMKYIYQSTKISLVILTILCYNKVMFNK